MSASIRPARSIVSARARLAPGDAQVSISSWNIVSAPAKNAMNRAKPASRPVQVWTVVKVRTVEVFIGSQARQVGSGGPERREGHEVGNGQPAPCAGASTEHIGGS